MPHELRSNLDLSSLSSLFSLRCVNSLSPSLLCFSNEEDGFSVMSVRAFVTDSSGLYTRELVNP
ncbi:hypothetical protein Bca4012_018989 [Brassica carinata]